MVASVVKLFVRLPTDLHAALVDSAKNEHRSLNGQIIHLLTEALRPRKAAEN